MSDPRRQMEELHSQPEWWRIALASIGDAVITTDNHANITYLNPVAESLTGWTLAEAAGVPLDDVFRIINEDSHLPVANPATRALREGVVVGLANHTLLIAKDGTERPIDDSAAPIRNERGEVAGVVLVFRDVTERRHQEIKVRAALDYADNIIATVRESLVILDKNLRIKTANRTFYQTFKVEPRDTESKAIYDVGGQQWDIPELRTLLEEIIPQNHDFRDFEVEHDFPTIGRKVMLLNARRFVSMDSIPELILLAIEDITERKQAEAAVRDSELRYRRLFETARDGILILDAKDGKITDTNPFMTEILGYPPSELKDKELWQIGLFKDRQTSRDAVRQLQERGYIRYDDLPLETKSGERVEVEFVSNVYQVDHHPVIQCNIRSISERRQLERTQLQAEELADLHRRKDEFLAMLGHELRNPLAPIANAVQLLGLQKNEDALQQQARTIIERQVGQLKHLVDDLLEISRITTGRVQLRQERIALNGIVERAVETAHPLIEQRRHALTVTVPPQPIWLYADAARLEQVVVNLLTNAAKYTDDGGHVWLTAQQEGDEAVVRVRDTGVGINPDLLPRIFDLFTQAERSLARSEGGLGIGLALVQRLVELHRGRVEARSSLGQGSEFVVRLPVMLAPVLPPPPPPTDAARPTASLRVLVVDDNVDAAVSLADLLRAFRHDTRTAHDGLTAVEAAIDYRPDVVLLDIGLPKIDGYEVAKRIRQQPTLKAVVLVAMTGYGQESDRQRSQEAGFDHHLTKPADFGKVQQILATVSEKKT